MLQIDTDFTDVVDDLREVQVAGSSVQALRRSVDTKEASASGGAYTASDTVFHFPTSEVSRPVIGNQIVDEDGTWTILSVQLRTTTSRWRCVCRELSIEDVPENRVSIQKANNAKGPTGANEVTWENVSENILARVHFDSARVSVEHQNRHSTTQARVYFTTPQELGPAHRIIASDGTVLKVLSWEGFNSIEQLFSALCEVSPWPQS